MKHLNEYELWNYLEDNLSGNELEIVREHLNECEDCSSQLKINGAIIRELMDHKSARLSPHFTVKVLSKLNLVKKRKRVFSFAGFPFLIFGLFFVVILGTIVIYYSQTSTNFGETYSFGVYLKDIIEIWERTIREALLNLKVLNNVTYLYLFGSILVVCAVEFILSKVIYRRG